MGIIGPMGLIRLIGLISIINKMTDSVRGVVFLWLLRALSVFLGTVFLGSCRVRRRGRRRLVSVGCGLGHLLADEGCCRGVGFGYL